VVYRELYPAEIFVTQDCRVVEAGVAAAFAKVDGRIVYVGHRDEWKGAVGAKNRYREEPWKVQGVPTIVRLNEDGEEMGRLTEDEIRDEEKLRMFVDSAA